MTSDRSYRKAIPQDVVRDEILHGKGTQFDPDIAEVMLNIIDEDKEYDLRQNNDLISNILIVDDDELMIHVVKRILKDTEDIRIFEAQSGDSALSMIEEKDISLVLLDLMLPDMDGFELFRKIREKHDTAVILMTGEKSREIIRTIDDLNIDDYVTKPLNEAILREAVHGILHRTEAEI